LFKVLNAAIQVALVTLYRSFGIEPSAVIGHSSGEMVAGWAVGIASTDSLCRVVSARAKGQHKVTLFG
jgi:acyl transferase domain-containing protein